MTITTHFALWNGIQKICVVINYDGKLNDGFCGVFRRNVYEN